MRSEITFIGSALIFLIGFVTAAQTVKAQVTIVGEMKSVMWKGDLSGRITLSEIANKRHLYGFGPVEYLVGETLIIDGRSYRSTVVDEKTMKVEETFDLRAPFFAYANISDWTEHTLPDTVSTLEQLEQYLDKETKKSQRPFLFKIVGTVDEATIHVVNLPKGTKVSSPKDAHIGQTDYQIENEQVEIVGFFSTEHKAIFTHHDTFLHVHLITKDRAKMGHLDKARFKNGTMKIYLPS